MIYMANPCSSPAVVAKMLDGSGQLGFIDTPRQQNIRPAGVVWCADNGCYTSTKWSETRWWSFLERHANDTERCIFATAPDVVGDAWRTHIRSLPWLPKIRALGYPAAYVAQAGIDRHPMMPWDEFDVLFLGGTTEWKLGPVAVDLAAEAKARGKWLHMGRVNSGKRSTFAASIGCDSVDGTFLRFAPNHNLDRLLRWPAFITTPREHHP